MVVLENGKGSSHEPGGLEVDAVSSRRKVVDLTHFVQRIAHRSGVEAGSGERAFSRNHQLIEFSLAFLEHRDNRILDNRLEVRCFTVKFYRRVIVVLFVEYDDTIVFR
jgi:hypothetical protein